VRCAALVDVHGELGEATDERAGGSRVVEMDVGQEDRSRRSFERLEDRLDARLGPRVDHDSVALPRPHDAGHALVVGVDQSRQGSGATLHGLKIFPALPTMASS
jgi:hypothetical protein